MKTVTVSVMDGGFLIQARDLEADYILDAVRMEVPEVMDCVEDLIIGMLNMKPVSYGATKLAPGNTEQ